MSQNFDPNAFFDAYYRSGKFSERFIAAAFTGLPLTPMSLKRRALNADISIVRSDSNRLTQLHSQRVKDSAAQRASLQKAEDATREALKLESKARDAHFLGVKKLIGDPDVLKLYPRSDAALNAMKIIEKLKAEKAEIDSVVHRFSSRRETKIEQIDDRTFRIAPKTPTTQDDAGRTVPDIPDDYKQQQDEATFKLRTQEKYFLELEQERVSTHPEAVKLQKLLDAATLTHEARKARSDSLKARLGLFEEETDVIKKEMHASVNQLKIMKRSDNQMAIFDEKNALRVLKKQRRIAARAEAALSRPQEVLSEPITRASHFHRTPGIALLHAAPVISAAPASAPLGPIRLLPTSRLGKQVALGAAVVGAVAGLRFGRTDGVQPQQPQGPSAEGMQIRDFLQRDG